MEQTTFLGHYRISVDDNGVPRERGRAGPAISYEAIDERSGELVALKLIPISSIDPAVRDQFEEQARAASRIKHVNIAKVLDFGRKEGHFVYVFELLQGEPLASWVKHHGPMPADAVLRVAEQIVSVLSTARFHKVAHCAIQPSNLMIVPGPTPEGTWPFVKLLNFGLGELKCGLESAPRNESIELADARRTGGEPGKPNGGDECDPNSSVALQFASPEQLQYQTVDFRSEVYSLGATMYFMLTGAAPSPEMARLSRELSAFPKALRDLIANMSHRDPDQRPKDPVVLAETIRECLSKIERRQAFARRLGLPLAATIPRKSSATPLAQVLRGILVFTAIVVAAAVLGAFLLPPDMNPFRHRTAAKRMIGVPIGAPETSPATPEEAVNTPPVVANQPATNAAASSPAQETPATSLEQERGSTASPVAGVTPASLPRATGPEVSGQVTDSTSASRDSETASAPSPVRQSTSPGKRKKGASSTTQRRTGSVRARMVGITSDGRLIYRLPSGGTRIVAPDSDEDELPPSRRHRAVVPRERDDLYSPSQPFPPD